MNKIKSFCKRVRIDIILRAILLLVMAVLFFISPEDAITSATLVLSIFIICDGVFSFVLYFFTGGLSGLFGSTLLGAIFKILFGILLAINLDVSTTIFSLMFACYVIVVSANTIEESMYLRKVGQNWIVTLILGLVSLAGGITLLFMSPSTWVKAAGIITGITLLVACIEDVLLVISMYKVKKHAEQKVIDYIDVE